jgi:hypothetical protein
LFAGQKPKGLSTVVQEGSSAMEHLPTASQRKKVCPFFAPPFLAVVVVFFPLSLQSHHHAFLFPSKSSQASKIPFHKFHSILSAWLPLLFPTKK